LHGWVAALGVEAALKRNFIVRAEYSYADYGDYNFAGLPAIPGESYGFTSDVDYTSHTFSVGLGYNF
jgi:opacity protein-like surface antigen